MDTTTFTRRFRDLYNRLGKQGQKEFADFLGISQSSVSYYLNGKRYPKTDKTIKIAQYFQVDHEWLIGNDIEDSPASSHYQKEVEYVKACKKRVLEMNDLKEVKDELYKLCDRLLKTSKDLDKEAEDLNKAVEFLQYLQQKKSKIL